MPFSWSLWPGLKSGKNSSVTLSCVHFIRISLRAPFRISDLSCHLSTRKMRVRAADRSPSSVPYTRCGPVNLNVMAFNRRIHLERLTLRKPAALETLRPLWQPISRTLFLLLLSSISVIFSVSRSSWFLKSWLSSYPHVHLPEQNQPGHVSASPR